MLPYLCHCLFFPFWPGQLLVQHLIDTLDSTNLESSDVLYVPIKLYSTRLYNYSSCFRHLQKFSVHCHHFCSMIYWKTTLSKQFLIVARFINVHAFAVKCTADSTYDFYMKQLGTFRHLWWQQFFIWISSYNYTWVHWFCLNLLAVASWCSYLGETQPSCSWEM